MAFFEKNSKLYPVVLIILSCFFFSILAALIKYLNYFIHPFEQAFFRNLFSIFILILLFLIFKKKYIKIRKKKILFLRSLFGAITMLLLFWSYTLIPLSQAMAISFSTPLFIFLGGIVIFKEHTNPYKVFRQYMVFVLFNEKELGLIYYKKSLSNHKK